MKITSSSGASEVINPTEILLERRQVFRRTAFSSSGIAQYFLEVHNRPGRGVTRSVRHRVDGMHEKLAQKSLGDVRQKLSDCVQILQQQLRKCLPRTATPSGIVRSSGVDESLRDKVKRNRLRVLEAPSGTFHERLERGQLPSSGNSGGIFVSNSSQFQCTPIESPASEQSD